MHLDRCAMLALRCLTLLLTHGRTKKLGESLPYILKIVPVRLPFQLVVLCSLLRRTPYTYHYLTMHMTPTAEGCIVPMHAGLSVPLVTPQCISPSPCSYHISPTLLFLSSSSSLAPSFHPNPLLRMVPLICIICIPASPCA